MSAPKILVITPVRHIKGVSETLEATGDVTYLEDPTQAEVIDVIGDFDAIYTNPNKSRVFISSELLDAATRLRVIATASTGTNHIDKEYAAKKQLPILSLTEERHVIDKISSTAEHALALTMASLRRVELGHQSVLRGEWNYEPYIGRQIDQLTVGVLGYGRLGGKYAHYVKSMGSTVLVLDPYKQVVDPDLKQVERDEFLADSDIIALHVHVNEETKRMINDTWFAQMKPDVLIVNTSRGDLIDEAAFVDFLARSPNATAAVDVVEDEVRNREKSPLINYAHNSDQILITPHIGGMTREGQEIAYGHMAHLLNKFFAG